MFKYFHLTIKNKVIISNKETTLSEENLKSILSSNKIEAEDMNLAFNKLLSKFNEQPENNGLKHYYGPLNV